MEVRQFTEDRLFMMVTVRLQTTTPILQVIILKVSGVVKPLIITEIRRDPLKILGDQVAVLIFQTKY